MCNDECVATGNHLPQMLMDPMGGIVMTNDGNAILREVSLASSPTPSGSVTSSNAVT